MDLTTVQFLVKSLSGGSSGCQKVYVFNSCSASVGETLIGLKIQELEEKGLSFEEVVEQTEAYILSQDTWFVLENLDTLRKTAVSVP